MKSIKDVLKALTDRGFVITDAADIGPVAKLNHTFDRDDFNELITEIIAELQLKGQNDNWLPGTPTKDPADWGFYVCPIHPDDWDMGDFDMLIQSDVIYCC